MEGWLGIYECIRWWLFVSLEVISLELIESRGRCFRRILVCGFVWIWLCGFGGLVEIRRSTIGFKGDLAVGRVFFVLLFVSEYGWVVFCFLRIKKKRKRVIFWNKIRWILVKLVDNLYYLYFILMLTWKIIRLKKNFLYYCFYIRYIKKGV